MSSLPGHLFVGRASVAGPVTGAYTSFSVGPFTIAASQTDLVQASFKLPCDFRLERIMWNVRAQAVAGTLKFASGATRGTLTTNLLAVTSVNMGSGTGTLSGVCAPSGETSAPTTDTLSTVAGVRDIARDTFLNVAGTTDATVGGAVDVIVVFYGFITGFVNTNAGSD